MEGFFLPFCVQSAAYPNSDGASSILGVLDAQIMKKYRSQGMTALYVIAGSLLAQALQYGIIRLIY